MPYENFGPYELIARLGSVGGMGEVWRARDTRKNREVALKLLRGELAQTAGFLERFRRESEIAGQLSALNIVPVHDYGEINGHPFIEMRLIEGSDLGNLIRENKRLSLDRAVSIAEDISDALDSAHALGISHRDVKPSNILVADRGGRGDFSYLIDFGLTRAETDTRLTTAGAAIGTLAYMAPERFVEAGDFRADIYSLACVLFHAATGRPPFLGPSGAVEIGYYYQAHRFGARPRISEILDAAPRALDEVIMRGMSIEPSRRYSSAGELVRAARVSIQDISREEARSAPRGTAKMAGVVGTKVLTNPPFEDRGFLERDVAAGIDMRMLGVGQSGGRSIALTVGYIPTGQGSTSCYEIIDLELGLRTRTKCEMPMIAQSLTVLDRPSGLIAVADGYSEDVRRILCAWHPESDSPRFSSMALPREFTCSALTVVEHGDNYTVLLGGSDGTITLVDMSRGGEPLSTGKSWRKLRQSLAPSPIVEQSRFDGHGAAISAIAECDLGDRRLIVSGDSAGAVLVWDLQTLQPVHSFAGRIESLKSLAVTEVDGIRVVVTAGKTVQAWDLDTGSTLGPVFGENLQAVSVATTVLNGRLIAAVGMYEHGHVVDGSGILVIDPMEGRQLCEPLRGHKGSSLGVFALANRGGGCFASAGSVDNSIRTWDVAKRVAS